MKKGFTLIELLVVIAIMSILTAIVLSSLLDASCKSVEGDEIECNKTIDTNQLLR